ncbi:neurosecretory protein VGF [Amia ocellicauda]|uniref:neurosecretory protein VGF n=1 Tax=Amia ocellicauda TaxID=2972642 RepID=UPI0034642DF0
MRQCQLTASAPILLLLLLGTRLHVNSAAPVAEEKDAGAAANALPVGITQILQEELGERVEEPQKTARSAPSEGEDELFKDVDPKTLAAVLLQALNQQGDQKGGEEAREREAGERVREALLRRGQEGEEEEEEERRAKEEEERLTERVKSRTRSEGAWGATASKEGKSEAQQGGKGEGKERVGGQEGEPRAEAEEDEEEEEQLSPQEVKNLQAMLQELQSYSATSKRERDSVGGDMNKLERWGQWEKGREREKESPKMYQATTGSEANEILKELGMYEELAGGKAKEKKKEGGEGESGVEKKRGRLLYGGQNFLEDSDESQAGEEEEEEILSPEEEEARARAEQEEVRRQAAEAQRAREEEEKLADIASDLLLQYLVKPDGGDHKKQQQLQQKKQGLGLGLGKDQSKKSPFKGSRLDTAAEDKRSDEDDEDDEDEDDIDPQTIDKLIEISSKLHLPADDVVDIINDVEKKKKKDAPPEIHRHLPPPPPARSNKPIPPPTTPLKQYYKDKAYYKKQQQQQQLQQQQQQLQQQQQPRPAARPWPKPSYPSYPPYQKPFRSYNPLYYQPPKPRFRPSQELSLNDILGNSMDYDLDPLPKKYRPLSKPKPKLKPWARPQPSGLYISNVIHPRTFSTAGGSKRPRPFYISPPAPLLIPRDEDYYDDDEPESEEELENFIEKVLLKHPEMFH